MVRWHAGLWRMYLGKKNMTRLRMVEYQGESMCVKELARRTGLSYSALWHRITDEYMTGDEAVAAARASKGLYDVGGELLTAKQMAERCGLCADTIRERLRRGFTPTEAMEPRKVKPKNADGPTNRLKWPDKAFALIYNPDAKEIMRFRRLSENNWGWTSDFFTYMASKLGKRHVLLRAWWRESEEPAMLRLYLLTESEGKDDVLAEIVEQGQKAAMLRKWGLA